MTTQNETRGRGGLAHVKICLKSNMRQFEILGEFKDARRCKYVLRKVESGCIKDLDQYDAAWEEAKTKIK